MLSETMSAIQGPKLSILSLGAGVQSTCVYLMAQAGEIQLDAAIYADVQEEPDAVVAHLAWLQSLRSVPIYIRTAGKLGNDLLAGRNSTGQRFASIPAFTGFAGEKEARLRRQCTSEYKIQVVDRCLRRDILKLAPRKRIPRGTEIHWYFGISLEEARRTKGIMKRMAQTPWATAHFPLIERGMTRADCHRWMEGRVPHKVPRSACVFCPYHDDQEWQRIKTHDPIAWDRAVQIDRGLRSGNVKNRKVTQPMYLHRSLVPLELVEFKKESPLPLFTEECEGMCGV